MGGTRETFVFTGSETVETNGGVAMRFVLSVAIFLAFSTSVWADAPRPFCSSNLDVITFKDSSFQMAGDIVSENDKRVVMVPENGGRVELRRSLIGKVEYDARPPTHVTTDELVTGFTHCVSRLVGGKNDFRVVKVTPEAVYLNLGAEEGARSGIELSVYREGEELVDPETGASLGKEKNFVGVIQIIFADKKFSKAVAIDVPSEKIKEGDTGIYMRQSPVLAIAGITTIDGEESPYGAMLSEKLIGKFGENPSLHVVERRQLGKVLRELAIQNALLAPAVPDKYPDSARNRKSSLGPLDLKSDENELQFEPESIADKMRMIKGADAIIFGIATDVNGKAAINLRVVDTSTAAILFSAYKVVANPEKPVGSLYLEEQVAPTHTEEAKAETKTSAVPVKNRPASGDQDLLDRILRAIYNR
jgi:hypothetical protein